MAMLERDVHLKLLEQARRLWVPYTPRMMDEKLEVYGVDSGWNIRLYDGFYVYAEMAAAVNERQETCHHVIKFDLMSKDQGGLTPENAVKLAAENDEHYIAERASHEADLVLVDGSLLARLRSAENLLRIGPTYAEYLYLAKSLMDRENVVFFSKYSQDSSLLKGELGDIYYFGLATSGPGYALGPTLMRDNIPITIAYVRLTEYAAPLKIEVPANVGEDHIRRIMEAQALRTVKGYPYVLYLAHRTVSVSDRLMEILCKTAGLSGLSRPREVLEI